MRGSPPPTPSPQGGGEPAEYAATPRTNSSDSHSRRHRKHRLRGGELRREDHLDVLVEHLGGDRRGPLVLPVAELGRPVGHHVAREGRALERHVMPYGPT